MAFLRAFIELLKAHGGEYDGWVSAMDDDEWFSQTFSWDELQATATADDPE